MAQSSEKLDESGAHLPAMGVHYPLAEFEQRILADPDVLGMLYSGSLGRGGGDRCSDLDIELWVRDEVLDRPGLLEHYVGWLGTIQFVNATPHEHGFSSNCFVGSEWQQAELNIMDSQLATPHPYWHNTRVVKDTDGRLASLVAASGPPVAELTHETARRVIEETIYHIGFVTVQNVRGSYYHALGNVCELASGIYGLLAHARGRETYDVRFAEEFLSQDELALFYATWPAAPQREPIRQAARGLWVWTRYVWAQCEQVLGEELGISLDTAVFLEAIERPYDWDRPEPVER